MDVFTKPEVPRSDWELFKWIIFEPSLLEQYSDKLNRKETFFTILRVYIKWIVPFISTLFLGFLALLVFFNIPGTYPDLFKADIEGWGEMSGFVQQYSFLFSKLLPFLIGGLTFGLAFGLAGGLVRGLAFGLAFGLASGLAGGLAFGLASGLAFGLAFGFTAGLALGLALGLAFGIAFGFTAGLAGGLVTGLVAGFALGWASGMAFGLALGLGIGIGFYVSQFRLYIYPFYWCGIFKRYTFSNNPFLKDEGIWIRLPWVNVQLKKAIDQAPDDGRKFIDFLWRYRQLQRNLAIELEHNLMARNWKQTLQLKGDEFKNLPVFLRIKKEKGPQTIRQFILRGLMPYQGPNIDAWLPSDAWKNYPVKLKELLVSAESQTALLLKYQAYQNCLDLLQEWKDVHKLETFSGRELYFSVFEHWEKVLKNQLGELDKEMRSTQTVSLNPYSKGNALSPKVPTNNQLFMDRDDLKSDLSLKIQTSAVMPTFLILGQRRTGKTSLLNFLPELLGPRYAVAVIDSQSLSGEVRISTWLKAWLDKVYTIFDPEATLPDLPEDWLEAWDVFSRVVLDLSKTHQRKLILVMEEYDESFGFHYALNQHPDKAAALLARIRAFSQSQNEVVLMFVGASGFRDLEGEPQWVKYFVQVHILRVEYLSKSASLKLITQPVPDFKLYYSEGLAERIWELTQGHPHLIHSICSDLVDHANAKRKNPVGFEDLEYILTEKTIQRDEQPFINFWEEFCRNESMRAAVLTIANHEPVDEKLPVIKKLLDYRYIVKNEAGEVRLRVPLFEQWVLKHGY
jgi:hypothetical protein